MLCATGYLRLGIRFATELASVVDAIIQLDGSHDSPHALLVMKERLALLELSIKVTAG